MFIKSIFKNVHNYPFLIKKTFSNCQATYQKEPYFKKSNFFHRVNTEIGLPASSSFCLFSFAFLNIKRKCKKEIEEIHDDASTFLHLNVKTNK